MPINTADADQTALNQMWDKLVVSLEFADLTDADTRARLDRAAAAANNRGLQAAAVWQYAQALKMLTVAVEVWARLDHVPGEIAARNTRGSVYRRLGDVSAALDDHQAALELAHAHDLSGGEITARVLLGAAHAAQGDLETAETLLADALAHSTDAVDNWGTGLVQFWLGRVHEARKNWEAALKAYGTALEMWHILQAPVEKIETTAGLSRVALAQGFTADAYNLAEQVLEHLAQHGPVRLDEPLLVYWTVYRALHITRQAENARDILGAAHHMLEQQVASLSGEQRALFLNEVAVNRAIGEAWARANAE